METTGSIEPRNVEAPQRSSSHLCAKGQGPWMLEYLRSMPTPAELSAQLKIEPQVKVWCSAACRSTRPSTHPHRFRMHFKRSEVLWVLGSLGLFDDFGVRTFGRQDMTSSTQPLQPQQGDSLLLLFWMCTSGFCRRCVQVVHFPASACSVKIRCLLIRRVPGITAFRKRCNSRH